MKPYSQLYKFTRRFNYPRKKLHAIYNRYLWWCARRIGKGDYGKPISRDEQRKIWLGTQRFNAAGRIEK